METSQEAIQNDDFLQFGYRQLINPTESQKMLTHNPQIEK